ncbi:Cox family DNA-binding protein [Serratia sp. BW106]|jgi:hypothetical protein|uniref:Cox family DNA-binding protein n=1 Tax=Serratia TaxID=613 RepID=UPI000BFFB48D|nr:Cox family DNA-binding protein [Serratia sp. BW106]
MRNEAKTITQEDAADMDESAKKRAISLSMQPSTLLSKEGFALYVGKTPAAIVAMAKAGKLPAFYMADPLKPGSNAELWINRKEWDKYADQLVEEAAEEWHGWKDRISTSKPGRGRSHNAA